ncbi:hypothetical protein Tco_0974747 [Tanacetum coccineum]|uniref:Uncharacterized protein n=1 Tax=Tanacetum coccineum TaxID=301880 RepID=A0ABQ5ECF0_9ASTR
MDVTVLALGINGSYHVEDLIIPYEETSVPFYFTSRASFTDLLVKGIKDSTVGPDTRGISSASQLLLDAVKSRSANNGFKTSIFNHFMSPTINSTRN